MDLLDLLPPVKRCREHRLYLENGQPLLDLYLLGGKALWGHRPKGLGTKLKNQISTGVYNLPSFWQKRMVSHLEGMFPEYYLGFYQSLYQVENFLLKTTGDPVISEPEEARPGQPVFWRGGLPCPKASIILPVFPQTYSVGGVVLFSHQPSEWKSARLSSLDAIALIKGSGLFFQELPQGPPLKTGPQWYRLGPYLYYRGNRDYEEVFIHFLSAGILISPYKERPSVVPFQLTPGELGNVQKTMEAL